MSESKPVNDLLIVGATPGGLCTAVRAAREGLHVVVTTHMHYLGGMLSSGLGVWDTCYEGARAPLVEEFKARLREYYKTTYGVESAQYRTYTETLSLEPRAGERVFNDLVGELPNLSIIRQVYPIAVERSEQRIHAVILRSMDERTTTRIEATNYVDSTYEGDLAAVAGVPYRVGRESREEYGEPHAGRIFTQFTYGLFPQEAAIGKLNLRPFDLNSLGVFAGSTGEGDDAIQAFNFRSILCSDPDNRLPIEKPANYDRETYVVLLANEEDRQDKEYPFRSTWLIQDIRQFKFKNWKALPNDKLSWNHGSFIGQNHAYPRAGWKERDEIAQRHKDFDLGLLYFLQNDEDVPAEVRERASQWGLAKDEFADNGNFPYEMYIREARRIVGRYVFSEHDASLAPGLKRAPIHNDSIAIAEWPMDSHECRMERQVGSASDGMVLLNEKTRPAHIPYRIFLTEQFENLLVGVCASATHVGWGTIRVEPTMMHIGESLGYALALAREQGIAPVALDVAELQRRLVENDIMLSFFNEFDMHTAESWIQAVQYLGTKGFFASYDARPDEPLDAATMHAWVRLLGAWLVGEPEPNDYARRLPARSGEDIRASTFLNSINDELRYHGQAALTAEDAGLNGAEEAPLSRGEACRVLYDVIRR